MNGPGECHTEWSQSDREGGVSHGIPYVWNPKRNDTNDLTYKTETDLQTWRRSLWLPGEEIRERITREFGVYMYMYTLLYLKWITTKDLQYSTWNSAQCYVAAWMGGEFGGRMGTCICMIESLCCSPETINIVCKLGIPQYKIKSLKRKKINKDLGNVKITYIIQGRHMNPLKMNVVFNMRL